MSAERRNSKLLRTRRDRHKEHSTYSRQDYDEGVRSIEADTGKELRYSYPGHRTCRKSFPGSETVTASASAPDPSADPAVLLQWLRATENAQSDAIPSRTFSALSSLSSVNSAEQADAFAPLPHAQRNGHAHDRPVGVGLGLAGLDLILESGGLGVGDGATDAVTPMSDSVFGSDARESLTNNIIRKSYPSGDYHLDSNLIKRSSETEPLSPTLKETATFKFSQPHLEVSYLELDGSSSEDRFPSKPEDVDTHGHAVSPVDSSEEEDDEENPSFTILDVVANLYAIFMYLFDVGSDIYLAFLYYKIGEWWLFSLTATLVLIPALTVTAFSLVLYIMDHRNNKERGKYGITTCQWISRFMFLFLQCGLVLRYIDTLIYGFRSRIHPEKSRKQCKHWYREMLFEEVDSAMLRLYECFLEAAPQLMLQLYVMLTLKMDDGLLFEVARIVSCVTSLCSISWSLASYHRALRLTQRHTAKLSIPGFILQLVWHFLVLGARILALSLFAAFFPLFTGVVVLAHWCIMFAWVLTQGTRFFEPNRCREVWFNVIMAAVFTFAFVNLVEGHSRLKYTVYYIVVYAENTAMALAWYAASDDAWYTLPAMLGVFVVFPLGIAVQAVYYLYWHPNNYPPWSATKSIPLFREPERWLPRFCLKNSRYESSQRVYV